MKDIFPAKIAVVCFLFLVIIYFTLAVDYAIAGSILAAIFLFGLPAVWLFISSFIFFFWYLIFTFLALKFNFIGDLSVSSYFLFAGAMAVYFLQGQKNRWNITLPFNIKAEISIHDFYKLGGIAVLVILVYPLTSAYLAAITGYIAFLFAFKKSDGRYAFSIALLFLILCPFLLIANKGKTAEISAIFTYYFLVIGTIQEIIMMVKHPSEYKDEDEGFAEEKIDIQDTGSVKFMRHSERIKAYRLRLAQSFDKTSETNVSNRKKTRLLVLLGGVLAVIAFIFYKQLMGSGFTTDTSFDNIIKPTVTPKISSIISQVPVYDETKIASEASALKIYIENGTVVKGYAATIAAELRKTGINNISVGNADRGDYKVWELTPKNDNQELAEYIKKILNLETLRINPASASAKFDIVITIGENK